MLTLIISVLKWPKRPLLKNKIVAVYHCNETQEALTLWHQNPDFSNYVNEYFPHAKHENRDVSAQKEKPAFAQTPRESAFQKLLMRLGRNKQKKVISCLCHQFKGR